MTCSHRLPADAPVRSKENPLEPETLARRAAALAQERKAEDVLVIDVRGRSSYADLLVIGSGTSDRHVQSIAELVAEGLKHEGAMLIGKEGLREGQWALLDFGSVVIHVFHHFTRQVYDLEGLWQKAPRLVLAPLPRPARADSSN